MNATAALALTAALVLAGGGRAATPDGSTAWLQWGGPRRNFVVDAPPLATSWPAEGPRQIWRRPLGSGFSSIVTDGTTLYTLYRRGDDDVAIAMDAATGRTVWETRYAAPFIETCSQPIGPAPRAAPLVAGDRLVTVSAGGLMNSFDRRTGSIVWSLNLLAGADAVRACGYSSSPLAYKDRILTTAGGKGRGVLAIDAATGRIAWQAHDFENGYSSPILIDLDGRPELVVFTFGEISGIDPETGRLEWQRPHPADFGVNVATPVWGDDDHLLFVSSAYNGGSRVLKLARAGAAVSVTEVWATRRVRIHFGNAVRFGPRIFASNGDFGSAPLAAIDVATGEMMWRDRAVARATLVGAGSRLILLDEDGNLAIATPGDAGLVVQARAQILDSRSWTAPTLSGATLFVRNEKEIVALDLR